MAWDQTKPVYKSPLISNDIRENWAALYDMLSVEHDFFRGTHKALTLPSNGLTVGSTLKLTNNKVLVGYSVDQDGTSLLQVNGAGYFTYGIKFGDGSTQSTASYSKSDSDFNYAPKFSPIFYGVPSALLPIPANDNSNRLATTAYYINQAGTSTPLMAGTAAVGTSYLFARQDHKHPTDTSNFSATVPLMAGTAAVGTATTYSRSDHIHPTDTSRAPLNSPSFTGVPLVPTAALGTNTTQAASTAFVKATIDAIIGAAPGTLDTLNELAAALGNDPNFATTITNSIATKLAIAGGNLTGVLGIITGSVSSPSLCISGDTNTGLYSPAAGTLGITLGGTSKVIFSPTGDTLNVIGSINSTGGYVFPDGKTQLKAFQGLQNNGTNVPQRSRINVVGPLVSFSDDSVGDVSTITIDGNQAAPTVQYFSGNNSQTIFTLSAAPLGKDYTDVHIGGTYIPKSAYSLSGTTLTFNTAPDTGTNNIEVEWSTPLPISVPATNSVTSAMLVDNIALRGAPTAPTPILGDNSTRIATTAFLEEKFATLGDMATQNSADIHVDLISIGNGEFDIPSLRFGSQGTGLWSPAGDTIAISNGYTETLRITPSKALLLGRINYVASSEKLSVNGLGAFGTASYTIIGDDGTNSIIGSYSNKDLIFKTNNTTVARFTSTGNLLIGTAIDDGANKLQVNGNASVTALKVNSTTIQPACSADFGIGLGASDATYPIVQIKNSSAPVDKKYFRLGASINGAFALGRVNDAYSTETPFLRYDAGDNLYLSPAGLTALITAYIASATNYHQFNSSAGGTPVYYTQGSASDVSMGLSSKGTGNIFFYTNNAANAQFQVSNVTSAVNKLVVQGASTGNLVSVSAAGSDTNIGFGLSSKGTYSFGFWTGSGQQFAIASTNSAVNYMIISGSATGNVSNIVQSGSDAIVGIGINAKGNDIFLNTYPGIVGLDIKHVASSVNYMSMYGGVTGVGISLSAAGADTNIQNYIKAKGSYPTSFTGAGGAEQFRVASIASAVNYMQVQGAVASGYTTQSNAGTSTGIGHAYITKGAGPHSFSTGGGQPQFAIGHVASTVNFISVFGSTTGAAPAVMAAGSDANIDIALTPKGTGRVKGTMLSFACERSTLPNVGQTFAFGNDNSAGLGAVMPFAGKLVAVGISGLGVDGTLTADAYIDGVANSSYQISLTGSATNVKNYTQYATPLSFAAGTSINWQVSAVPTAGTGFVITFFVVFN